MLGDSDTAALERLDFDMTLLDTDPDAGLAPLQFQVMRNLQAKTDAEGGEVTSDQIWSMSAGRSAAGGTDRR